MGDLAKMTDADGRLNGHRLLLWLRSRAGIETGRALEADGVNEWGLKEYHVGRVDLLDEMAEYLERGLNLGEKHDG